MSEDQVEKLSDGVAESLYRQLLLALHPQLLRLGVENRKLPRSGRSDLGFATGYLLGVCEAIMNHNQIEEMAQDRFMVLVAMAFREVYEEKVSWDLALDSIDAFQAGEPSVVAGIDRAHIEMADVFNGKPWAAAMGFYLYVSGAMEV